MIGNYFKLRWFFFEGGGVEERGEEINIEWSELEKWKKGGERKKEMARCEIILRERQESKKKFNLAYIFKGSRI